MADQDIPPSLPSQILAKTLDLVERRKVFQPSEIEALVDLAGSGGFRKPELLVALLKKGGTDHETP